MCLTVTILIYITERVELGTCGVSMYDVSNEDKHDKHNFVTVKQ
jgi:hypothetical protein